MKKILFALLLLFSAFHLFSCASYVIQEKILYENCSLKLFNNFKKTQIFILYVCYLADFDVFSVVYERLIDHVATLYICGKNCDVRFTFFESKKTCSVEYNATDDGRRYRLFREGIDDLMALGAYL